MWDHLKLLYVERQPFFFRLLPLRQIYVTLLHGVGVRTESGQKTGVSTAAIKSLLTVTALLQHKP